MNSKQFRIILLIGLLFFALLSVPSIQAITDPFLKMGEDITNLYDDCNVHYEDVLYMTSYFAGDIEPQEIVARKAVFDLFATVQVKRADFKDFDQFAYWSTGILLMYLDVNKDGVMNDEESHFVIVMLTPRRNRDNLPYLAAIYRGHINDINNGTFLNEPNCGIYEVISFGELNKDEDTDKIPKNSMDT